MTTISAHDPLSCTKSKENQRERERERERERDIERERKKEPGSREERCKTDPEWPIASELTLTPFIEGFTLPDRDEFVTVRDELDLRVGRFARASPGSLVEERWYLIERSEGCPDSENFDGGGDICQRSIRE
ncbi:unnamed protein product [Brassica napus]|uniref:(rape) hypothetical protein n=1 Tax=Brassica napus TaxID=3708 RepID=A0A816IUQ4_BRANA|nr:unnamed protein product [Brassica napus]